jgi:hypothetical protein
MKKIITIVILLLVIVSIILMSIHVSMYALSLFSVVAVIGTPITLWVFCED